MYRIIIHRIIFRCINFASESSLTDDCKIQSSVYIYITPLIVRQYLITKYEKNELEGIFEIYRTIIDSSDPKYYRTQIKYLVSSLH